MKRLNGIAALIAAVMLLVGSSPASASTILVTTESGITNDGLLDWGALGAAGTPVSNPFSTSVPGVAGLTITGSEASGSFQRVDQNSGWAGNFAPGEELLWTNLSNGPMDFVFNSLISGFGFQIQADFFGAFTARIEAFDSSNASLGFFTVDGNSTPNGDDAAIFIGILSDTQNIKRINIGVPVEVFDVQDFAINAPRIQATPDAAPVPEPASMLLLGTGLIGLARRRSRGRS